jgi:protein-tyrosine phosphatase
MAGILTMKKILDSLSNQLLSLLGINFEIELREDFFNRILPDIYLGCRPTPEQINLLKKAGITHIVSCLNQEKQSTVAFLADDFQTLFLPVRDAINEDLASVFPAFFAFVEAAQTSGSRAKILVHCEVGVSRSASLVLALLMNRKRKSFIDAYHELRLQRAKVLPNIGFASQLQKFEHSYAQEKPSQGQLSSLAQYLHQVCNVPVEIELLQAALEAHDYNALSALKAVFGEEIPRVIQGVRV